MCALHWLSVFYDISLCSEYFVSATARRAQSPLVLPRVVCFAKLLSVFIQYFKNVLLM